VARRAVFTDAAPDRRLELGVERDALVQHDEERHPALRPGAGDVDDERVQHLGYGKHGAVDLTRAHADAAAVDGRVGAAVDDRRVPRGDLDPVSVPPYARVHVEVGLAIARAVVVAPEEHGHRGQRLGDDELADLVDERSALLVERLHLRTERAPLQLTLVDRQRRHAADEGCADVGTAARREEPRVPADVVVDPAEPLGGKRRPGRPDAPQCAEVASGGRLDPGLHAGCDVRGARAEAGHLRRLCEIPQPSEIRMAGVAVEEHDGGIGQQRPDEQVPHHPARRGEPEEAVAGVDVEVQVRLLELLEQDTALAVHDRLRQPGRARGIEHPQRVVEGQPLEGERAVA